MWKSAVLEILSYIKYMSPPCYPFIEFIFNYLKASMQYLALTNLHKDLPCICVCLSLYIRAWTKMSMWPLQTLFVLYLDLFCKMSYIRSFHIKFWVHLSFSHFKSLWNLNLMTGGYFGLSIFAIKHDTFELCSYDVINQIHAWTFY